ncbi:MAG: signal peptidase I [Candidatus Omnitrophota bacterium]|jgi:signal peptidase I
MGTNTIRAVKSIENEGYGFYLRQKGGVLTVIGKSMLPTLQEGWKVKIAPVKPEEIKIGDVITFSSGRLFTHRVIGKFRSGGRLYFFHKGDNDYLLSKISSEYAIGKVIEVIRSDKINYTLNSPHPIVTAFYKFIVSPGLAALDNIFRRI